jgi:hypothetical protein
MDYSKFKFSKPKKVKHKTEYVTEDTYKVVIERDERNM